MQRVSTRGIALLFVCLGCLLSQTTSTSILGTVTDPSGAVVVGAKVTVQQVGTGLKREERTSSGLHRLRHLRHSLSDGRAVAAGQWEQAGTDRDVIATISLS